jgi:hypothetical protein
MPYDNRAPGGVRGEGRAVVKNGDFRPGVKEGSVESSSSIRLDVEIQ